MKCPNCGSKSIRDDGICASCGFDLLKEAEAQQRLLDTNPLLIKQNNRYVIYGIIRLISMLEIIFAFALYGIEIENGFAEFLGCLVPFSAFVCLIFCVLRGILKRKIKKELNSKEIL